MTTNKDDAEIYYATLSLGKPARSLGSRIQAGRIEDISPLSTLAVTV